MGWWIMGTEHLGATNDDRARMRARLERQRQWAEAFEHRLPQSRAEAEGHAMQPVRTLSVDVCECGSPIPTSIGRCGACGGIIPPVAPTGHQPDPTPTPAQRWRNLRALVDKFNERARVSRVLLNPGGASAWVEAAADLLEALYGPGDPRARNDYRWTTEEIHAEHDRIRRTPQTCAEAGDRCRHECTIDTRTGLIRDPDCFRHA